MLTGVLSLSSFAAGTPTGNEYMNVTLTSPVTEAGDGDIITIFVHITNNFYATNMRWPVFFDSAAFELVGTNGNATAYGALAANSSRFDATDCSGMSTLYPARVTNVNRQGLLLLHWVGTADSGTTALYNQPTGMNCISFQLRVKEGASGTGNVFIPATSTLFYNQAISDPSDPSSIYRWNLVAGSTLGLTPVAINLGALDPGIGAAEGSPIIFEKFSDEDATGLGFTGYIYGFDDSIIYSPIYTEEDYAAYFLPVGGASMTVTPAAEGYGTGTKIEISYSGVVIETYYVVVFGDVTGDSIIDDNDITNLNDATMYMPDWMNLEYDIIYGTVGSPYKKAADIDGDTAVDTNDFSELSSVFYVGKRLAQDGSGETTFG